MSPTPCDHWVDVAPADDVPAGDHRVYEVEGRFIAVYHAAGDLYAVEDRCTHDDNPISDGPVEGLEVICTRHGARFCLKSGAALTPPAYEPLTLFATRVMDGRLWIGLP
jgi:3-phenylpropionate/trans-cinnamate dioxygenase ferredoxin subunit